MWYVLGELHCGNSSLKFVLICSRAGGLLTSVFGQPPVLTHIRRHPPGMSRRLSPAVAQDTRNEATPPAPMFRQQPPLGTTLGATSGEGSDTLVVARSLIRLASEFSPSSLPTSESLEMAASAYQVAMKLHQPNPSINTSAKSANPPGQLNVIEDVSENTAPYRSLLIYSLGYYSSTRSSKLSEQKHPKRSFAWTRNLKPSEEI